MKTNHEMHLNPETAFLFDVDGVIVETPHEEAWKAAAVELGIIPETNDFTGFYSKHIAGEPGIQGAAAILENLGDSLNPPFYQRLRISDKTSKLRLAAEFRDKIKQRHLDRFIQEGKFRVFEDVLSLIFKMKLDALPIAAVSASENAQAILASMSAEELACKINIGKNEIWKGMRLADLFDANILGAKSHWHNIDSPKLNHYCYARGYLLGKCGFASERVPYTFVFEDAVKGISAISSFDFYCIGISRKSTTGAILSSKEELLDAGAVLAYDEQDMKEKAYDGIMADVEEIINHLQIRKNAGTGI